MTSKEYLDLFERDSIMRREAYEAIKKDLEILEILKPKLKVEKGGTWWYLDVKHCFFENEEQIRKIKEWLNEN